VKIRCPRCTFSTDDIDDLRVIIGTYWHICPECGYMDFYEGFIDENEDEQN